MHEKKWKEVNRSNGRKDKRVVFLVVISTKILCVMLRIIRQVFNNCFTTGILTTIDKSTRNSNAVYFIDF